MKHFTLSEVMHPDFFSVPDPWSLRNPLIWERLDAVREAWGKPIYINRGELRHCGMRPLNDRVGATKSHHKPLLETIQAFDLHGSDTSETFALYRFCEEHWKELKIIRMESFRYTPGWVHIELTTEEPQKLIVFNP